MEEMKQEGTMPHAKSVKKIKVPDLEGYKKMAIKKGQALKAERVKKKAARDPGQGTFTGVE